MRKLGRGVWALIVAVFALVCLALTLTGHVWAFALMLVVLGPLAARNWYRSKKAAGRNGASGLPPCRACGGYGRTANGPCQACGGFRTRP